MTIQEQIELDRIRYKKALSSAPQAPKCAKVGAGYYATKGYNGDVYLVVKNTDGWELDGSTFPTKKEAIQSIV
jgi:hypothetical protein